MRRAFKFLFGALVIIVVGAGLAGLVATGALVSRVLGAHPSSDALARVGFQLLLPIALLLIEAVSVERAWRLWTWLTFIAAILVSFWFAQ